jgi:hypothetical protein
MTNSNLNYYGITSQTIHGVERKNSYLLTVADLYYLLYGKIVHFLLIKKKIICSMVPKGDAELTAWHLV